MKLPAKSTKQHKVDIQDYYAVKVREIWTGFKLEGPAFIWLCVYFFFEYVRPQKVYPVIDILPWAQIALLLAVVHAFSDRSVTWVRSGGNSVLVMFFFVAFLSGIFAFRPSASFLKIDIIIGWIVLYFLIITVINSKQRYFVFLLLFFLVNFKMSQFGFRSFITSGYSSWGVSGSPGWFKDSGDLGIEMSIFVPLLIGFGAGLRHHWGKYKKLFFYFVVLTGVVTVIATTSRGAMLGVLATAIWFLVIKRQVKVLFGMLVLALFIYAILPDRMVAEFGSSGTDVTSLTRIAHWEFGWDISLKYPLLGVGYENWLDYCWFMNPTGLTRGSCWVAHNTYVTAIAEVGFIGMALYMLLITHIFIKNYQTRKYAKKLNDDFSYFVAYGLDGGLIGYMVSTIFFTVLWYPMLYVQLALTVALYEITKRNFIVLEKEKRGRGSAGRFMSMGHEVN